MNQKGTNEMKSQQPQINIRLSSIKKKDFHRACFDFEIGMQHYVESAVDRLISFHEGKLTKPESAQVEVIISRAKSLAECAIHG